MPVEEVFSVAVHDVESCFFENSHVLTCEVLNQESKFKLNSLINGSLNEMKICLKQWKENMKNIEAIDAMDSFVHC